MEKLLNIVERCTRTEDDGYTFLQYTFVFNEIHGSVFFSEQESPLLQHTVIWGGAAYHRYKTKQGVTEFSTFTEDDRDFLSAYALTFRLLPIKTKAEVQMQNKE